MPWSACAVSFPFFLFFDGIALSYLAAPLSLLPQLPGLYGATGGVEPLQRATPLSAAAAALGLPPLLLMKATCIACALLALLALLSPRRSGPRRPPPGALYAALALLYGAILSSGGTFLSFQWDILLVEAGWLAAVAAPRFLPSFCCCCRRGAEAPPSPSSTQPRRLGAALARFAFLKLMLMSGAVKIQSGCPTWQALTATEVHFASQPIPHPGAWWAHQAPPLAHRAAVGVTLWAELPALALLLIPTLRGRFTLGVLARRVGVVIQVALQGSIIASGNYAFFNWLTAALALAAWPTPPAGKPSRRAVVASAAVLAAAVAASFVAMFEAVPLPVPPSAAAALPWWYRWDLRLRPHALSQATLPATLQTLLPLALAWGWVIALWGGAADAASLLARSCSSIASALTVARKTPSSPHSNFAATAARAAAGAAWQSTRAAARLLDFAAAAGLGYAILCTSTVAFASLEQPVLWAHARAPPLHVPQALRGPHVPPALQSAGAAAAALWGAARHAPATLPPLLASSVLPLRTSLETYHGVSSFHLASGYGLFRSMTGVGPAVQVPLGGGGGDDDDDGASVSVTTTARPELVLQGWWPDADASTSDTLGLPPGVHATAAGPVVTAARVESRRSFGETLSALLDDEAVAASPNSPPPAAVAAAAAGRGTWRDIPWRYKPSDPWRPPPFVAPHQPRLDWQAWFAALGNYNSAPWFPRLVWLLLRGAPAAYGLLDAAGYPVKQTLRVAGAGNNATATTVTYLVPPAAVRVVSYSYDFTRVPPLGAPDAPDTTASAAALGAAAAAHPASSSPAARRAALAAALSGTSNKAPWWVRRYSSQPPRPSRGTLHDDLGEDALGSAAAREAAAGASLYLPALAAGEPTLQTFLAHHGLADAEGVVVPPEEGSGGVGRYRDHPALSLEALVRRLQGGRKTRNKDAVQPAPSMAGVTARARRAFQEGAAAASARQLAWVATTLWRLPAPPAEARTSPSALAKHYGCFPPESSGAAAVAEGGLVEAAVDASGEAALAGPADSAAQGVPLPPAAAAPPSSAFCSLAAAFGASSNSSAAATASHWLGGELTHWVALAWARAGAAVASSDGPRSAVQALAKEARALWSAGGKGTYGAGALTVYPRLAAAVVRGVALWERLFETPLVGDAGLGLHTLHVDRGGSDDGSGSVPPLVHVPPAMDAFTGAWALLALAAARVAASALWSRD